MTTGAMTSIAPERVGSAAGRAATPADRPLPLKAFTNVLVVSAIATVAITLVMLFGLDGWTYYRAPRAVRGYLPAHQWLRPSGSVGQATGIAGMLLMFVPMLYAVRKHSVRLARFGSMKTWLELHIFCGIVGPVLVTYHTSFKFNGIVSVAYWLMVVVASSGFVGRYLYVRVPRSMRGTELTLVEVQRRADLLKSELAASGIPAPVLARVTAIEARAVPSARPGAWLLSLVVGDLVLHYRLWALGRALRTHGGSPEHDLAIRNLIAERALLLRRLTLLDRTRRLFELWHVFHQPLVAFLLLIVVIHVALVTYMGYTVLSGWFPS